MVDEPQGDIYGGVGGGARVREDRLVRAAVPAHPAAVALRRASELLAA